MSLTNKDIILKLEDAGIDFTIQWLMEVVPSSSSTSVNESSYRTNLKKLMTEFRKVQSNKKMYPKRYSDFMKTCYAPPKKRGGNQRSRTHEVQTLIDDIASPGGKKEAEEKVAVVLKRKLGEATESLRKKTKLLDETVSSLEIKKRALSGLQNVIQKKNSQLKRLRSNYDYKTKQVTKLEKTREANLSPPTASSSIGENQLSCLSVELKKAKERISELEAEVSEFKDSQSSVVETFDVDRGRYGMNMQNCVHNLLTHGVSENNVSVVIADCLELAGKTASRLPSQSTVNKMNVQRLLLAQHQIDEEVVPQEDTTLSTDETSKYGDKYMTYSIHVKERQRPYVLGLRDIITKSAKSTLDVFKEILGDIDGVSLDSKNNATLNLIYHVRNTMSDRAATEKKFNELLELYRADVLPEMVDNWDKMSPEDQAPFQQMNNFFCGLHSLVHIAEACDKILAEVETTHFNGNVPIYDKSFGKKESASVRCVRVACKAFAYGGDDKNGCHGAFKAYIQETLKKYSMRSLPLTPFRGNRFNILFHNAAIVYFFSEEMETFLAGHGSNKWVLYDLQQEFFIAGCKALGLICKLITTPLWKLLEDKTVHILKMNDYYLQLVTFLQDAAENLDAFMNGQLLPFGAATIIKRDTVFMKLVSSSKHDGFVKLILGSLLPGLADLCRKLFADHLPGGKFATSSSTTRAFSESAPKHNKFPETIFAYLDRMLRFKPNVTTLAAEACVMFSLNRTREWLQSKSRLEQQELYQKTYKSVAATRKMFKQRQDVILQEKLANLKERQKKNEATEARRIQKRLAETNAIIYWGLWQSEEQMQTALQNIKSDTEKRDALKSQLRFREHVLKQKYPSDPNVFKFSKERKQFSIAKLSQNLINLITSAFSNESAMPCDSDSPLLVGKRVRHQFKDGESSKWYEGKVISQVPGYPQWFNITYKGEEAVYSYRLLEDYKEGDLQLLV